MILFLYHELYPYHLLLSAAFTAPCGLLNTYPQQPGEVVKKPTGVNIQGHFQWNPEFH